MGADDLLGAVEMIVAEAATLEFGFRVARSKVRV